MNFYDLVAIVGSEKKPTPLANPTSSFCVVPNRAAPYIEPTFEKVVFEHDRPTVLLISAVGATGKTTLAHVLSNRISIPRLDLANHKPVGDNSLRLSISSNPPPAHPFAES